MRKPANPLRWLAENRRGMAVAFPKTGVSPRHVRAQARLTRGGAGERGIEGSFTACKGWSLGEEVLGANDSSSPARSFQPLDEVTVIAA